jgi:hypothetical protein
MLCAGPFVQALAPSRRQRMKNVQCSLHDPTAFSCALASNSVLLVIVWMSVAPVVRPEQPANTASASSERATGRRRADGFVYHSGVLRATG